ncbi:MAG: shikimate kinase [Pseudomonadota bacterium]
MAAGVDGHEQATGGEPGGEPGDEPGAETGDRLGEGLREGLGGGANDSGRLRRSIVLIGLMGAGKSSVGHRLAAALGAPFVDSDAEIEAAAAMTIADIFRLHGEASFRAGERRVIARLLTGPASVIATGGGAFMDPETRALIASEAVSVWLKADLDTLHARTAGRSHRPLLNTGDPRAVLAQLMDERYPIYAEATLAVESQALQSHESMVARIIKALATVPGTLTHDDAEGDVDG